MNAKSTAPQVRTVATDINVGDTITFDNPRYDMLIERIAPGQYGIGFYANDDSCSLYLRPQDTVLVRRGPPITKAQYKQARRLVRNNGRSALGWLPERVAKIMEEVFFAPRYDRLADRAHIVAYCQRVGITVTARQTGRCLG